ncbi:MAG: hypothetical protein WAS73_03985 [Defluviicoccus sp.]
MALNLSKTVADYLKQRAEQKCTARQIAQWVFETYPADCQEKMAKSTAIKTDAELKQQSVAEIGSQRPQLQKKHPQIKATEGRPRQYYWSDKTDQAEVSEAESEEPEGGPETVSAITLKEYDLYPL